jgi:hypothetical protein
MFITIAKNIEELFSAEGHLALVDKFETLEKLVRFALKINPEETKNVRNLLKFTEYHIELAIGSELLAQPLASEKLRLLISCPIATFKTGTAVFELEHLPRLMVRLLPVDRLSLANTICKLFLSSSTAISTDEQLDALFDILNPLLEETPVRTTFFAVFHLINGGSLVESMALFQRLANKIEQAPPAAADKAILPLGFCVLKFMPEAEPADLKKLVQFIAVYGKNAAARNPAVAVQLFVETARVLDTIEGTDDAAAELSATAIELWNSLGEVPSKQRLYPYLVQFVFGSRSVDLAVNPQLCNFASTFTDPLQAASALANCAPLFWRADGRCNEGDKVQACLAKATKLAATNSDLKVVLEGLYCILGWTAY